MSTFTVITLGCKVNQYESDTIAGQLAARGWVRSTPHTDADLIIVNTCAVTGKAAMQSRQAIRQAIKSSPDARIVVTGCYAQTAPSDIENIPGVHTLVGHADKYRIPDLVQSTTQDAAPCPAIFHRTIRREHHFDLPGPPVLGSRTRQTLKVQDGCDSFCTYCIVPYARGRSRSMNPDDVLEHLGRLGASGCKEAILTGIHLGCYGSDLDPKSNLAELLDRIERVRPIQRVRLSSIEPHEITGDIVARVAASNILCNHFHIPLQSGDDEILDRMHRPYTGAFFTRLVKNIICEIPEAAIGVDILVGFPGETDAAFDRTFTRVKALPIAYLHVFPFSPRPGTPAAGYASKVPDRVIKERCAAMRRLGEQKRQAFYGQFLGKRLDILVEDARDPKSGMLKGFSANYVPVRLPGPDQLKNAVVCVSIRSTDAGQGMAGVPCEPGIPVSRNC